MPDPAAAYDQLQYLVDVLGFQFQLREGINLRISVIHLASGVVSSPKPMRAELGLTVEELKRHIGEEGYTDIVYNLNSSCMRLVMREKDYWSDISVSDISDVGGTLKEIFNMRRHNSSHTQLLYVSSDPEDYQKGFRDSLMYKCIEFDFNWIPLNITIPPGPKASIPTTTNKRNGKIIMKIITIEEENRGEKRSDDKYYFVLLF
ncbi:PREDICTED: uncharacterized protein LOC109582223 isoform X2 [Amphimedon queenslandica]|nr:PREDICTED: uncharacterized protein LOC109582223 isoform X2 [Amphimedon queenslandica]|eukprot:XP_019852438.1 PREDICTED: uncharacterized protein LOC109582223 isoform X2 [Amphimedon queenslandica]